MTAADPMRLRCGLVVAVMVWCAHELPAQVMKSPPRHACLTRDSVAPPRVFAVANHCFIEWINALGRRDQVSRDLALQALSTTGGRPAVDALRAEYDRAPDRQTRLALIRSMATTGSAEDVAFLMTQVGGPFVGNSDIWPITEAAATTLGLLRAVAARDTLRRLLQQYGRTGFAGRQVEWALEAIDRPPCADSVSGDLSRELVRIVMACRPPALQRQSTYRDVQTSGTWRFDGDIWRHYAGAPDSSGKTVSAAALISAEGQDAIVLVATRCGPLCGEGWTFQLRREGRLWRVLSARFDWVS